MHWNFANLNLNLSYRGVHEFMVDDGPWWWVPAWKLNQAKKLIWQMWATVCNHTCPIPVSDNWSVVMNTLWWQSCTKESKNCTNISESLDIEKSCTVVINRNSIKEFQRNKWYISIPAQMATNLISTPSILRELMENPSSQPCQYGRVKET